MPKIRVLVVDDAVVMRRLISTVLESDAELEVAGIAPNGKIALARIPQVNPDVITLDVEMPEMDGLETILEIRKLYPRLPVIMFSTMTRRGAVETVEALARGATDYVTKPANIGSVSEGMERLRSELIPKIKAYARPLAPPVAAPRARAPDAPRASSGAAIPGAAFRCSVIAIGTSTGGPNALHEVLSGFPASLAVPVLIVQHMPPVFTELLAARLDQSSKIRVDEARDGMRIEPGHAYLAPGGKHLAVAAENGSVRVRLNEEPPENSCRPAVDVLFRSVAHVYGGGTLGVVLTGMGQDGLRGAQWIHEAGGKLIAQDQASSVVWGMPGALAEAGLADEIVALRSVSESVLALANVKGRR
jgi:two-component system, chemotaxis family, protein-glutamate methylesterase/glutaminase